MGRPKKITVTARLKPRGRRWSIRWSARGEEFWLGLGEVDQRQAELLLAEINIALAGRSEWPEWSRQTPAVQRYLGVGPKTGSEAAGSESEPVVDWIAQHLAARSVRRPKIVESRLRELDRWANEQPNAPGISRLSPGQLERFLSDLHRRSPPAEGLPRRCHRAALGRGVVSGLDLAPLIGIEPKLVSKALRSRPNLFERVGKGQYIARPESEVDGPGRSPKTRNRYLSDYRVFYAWLRRQGVRSDNPAEEIGRLSEPPPEEIVWCDRLERDQLLGAARGLGGDEDLPATIAFYAGLRRGEIARLRWIDIDLGSGWISVGRDRATQTKTGKARTVPIFAALRERLEQIPAGRRGGRVVDCWSAEEEIWNLEAQDYLDRLRAAAPELAAVKKVGFNCWRHTFCSLLAQTGKLSIDQIAAISGHTPEVCRRHYAHLIPRDRAALGVELD